ncbi:unnamed protein product [Ilex paraguariensis]|uniref:Uncharacterized protein n=1 Tax=Ilex paraguariensis TaxID=185542 RepID=A0ABC8URA8_9AQUA
MAAKDVLILGRSKQRGRSTRLYNRGSSKKTFVNQDRCSGYPCSTSTDCKAEGELTVQMEGKENKRSSSHSHQPTRSSWMRRQRPTSSTSNVHVECNLLAEVEALFTRADHSCENEG